MSTGSHPTGPARPPVPLVGDGMPVPCADGSERPYLSLDAAASTAALGPVLARVEEFLPWYSSVHRGAGYKSQVATVRVRGRPGRRPRVRRAGGQR